VVLAANHQSHLDTPLILAALPRRLRYRVGVAMAKEFFDASFHRARYPRRRQMVSSLAYWLAALLFNAFPLPQREAGTRKGVRYIGELLDEGLSVLLFPEGRRTETGAILPFLPGIGMIGARLAVEVVPVRLEGVDRVLHRTWKVPRRGRVRIAFGSPLVLRGYDYAALSRQVEQAVRKL
jgi:long-chain acyl-CoA synthetase